MTLSLILKLKDNLFVLLVLLVLLSACEPETPGEMRKKAREYESNNQAQEALELRKKVHAEYLKTIGPDHYLIMANLGFISTDYLVLNNVDQAIIHQQEALDMARRLYGNEGIHEMGPYTYAPVAKNLVSLAVCYLKKGKHFEAIEFCNEANAINQKVFGEESAQLAYSLQMTGFGYFMQGNRTEARNNYEKNLAIQEKLGNKQGIERAKAELESLKQ